MTETGTKPRTIDLSRTKLDKDSGAELVFEEDGLVLRLYNQGGYDSTDTDINALIELMMTIPETAAIVEQSVKVHSKACPLLDHPCREHDFIHGKEAEELREGLKKLIDLARYDADELGVSIISLQDLLDSVDARDSLAWLEASDREPREPRHAHVEGICVPVCGEEENYLQFFPKTGDYLVGITNILEKAGAPATPWSVANAFDDPKYEHNRPRVEQYRTESGRSYPPLYRVRVHVFVEDVSSEEAEKMWEEFDRFEQGDDA
jgi:hypothetical protein